MLLYSVLNGFLFPFLRRTFNVVSVCCENERFERERDKLLFYSEAITLCAEAEKLCKNI